MTSSYHRAKTEQNSSKTEVLGSNMKVLKCKDSRLEVSM